MKILSTIDALLDALNRLLDLWRSYRERQAGRAQVEAEQLRKQIEARRTADEIDRTVADADVNDLRSRMLRYRRD